MWRERRSCECFQHTRPLGYILYNMKYRFYTAGPIIVFCAIHNRGVLRGFFFRQFRLTLMEWCNLYKASYTVDGWRKYCSTV